VKLDRDTPLALELVVVQDLLPHLALVKRLRALEQPIGQRRLAMIDMSDDAKIANQVGLHGKI
jgi:hypothetical protein